MKAKQLKKVLSITLASAVILSAVPVSPVIVEAESEAQKQEKETKEKTAAASQAEENKEEKPVEEKTEEKTAAETKNETENKDTAESKDASPAPEKKEESSEKEAKATEAPKKTAKSQVASETDQKDAETGSPDQKDTTDAKDPSKDTDSNQKAPSKDETKKTQVKVSWKIADKSEFTWDGTVHSVTDSKDYTLTITRDGNPVQEIKEPGAYTVTASTTDETKEITNPTITFIVKKVEVASFTWNGLSAVYTGKAVAHPTATFPNADKTAGGEVNATVSYVNAEELTDGEAVNAGTYTVKAELSEADQAHYVFSGDNTATLEITTCDVIVKPAGATKVYGADDNFNYEINSEILDESEIKQIENVLNGIENPFTRVAGENIGEYEISLSTDAQTKLTGTFNKNLQIDFKTDSLTITPLNVTIDPKEGQFKYYGAKEPEFTADDYSVSVDAGQKSKITPDTAKEELEGTLTRSRKKADAAGEYSYEFKTENTNYNVTVNENTKFEVKKLPVFVTPVEGQSKYYGQSDPVFDYNVSVDDSLDTKTEKDSETIKTELNDIVTRSDLYNENVDNYRYELISSEDINSNYDVTLSCDEDNTFEIQKLPLYIIPDKDQAKVYGEVDPAGYTWEYYYLGENDDIDSSSISEDVKDEISHFILTRNEGELPGWYAYDIVNKESYENYDLNIGSAEGEEQNRTFHIKHVTITSVDPVNSRQDKITVNTNIGGERNPDVSTVVQIEAVFPGSKDGITFSADINDYVNNLGFDTQNKEISVNTTHYSKKGKDGKTYQWNGKLPAGTKLTFSIADNDGNVVTNENSDATITVTTVPVALSAWSGYKTGMDGNFTVANNGKSDALSITGDRAGELVEVKYNKGGKDSYTYKPLNASFTPTPNNSGSSHLKQSVTANIVDTLNLTYTPQSLNFYVDDQAFPISSSAIQFENRGKEIKIQLPEAGTITNVSIDGATIKPTGNVAKEFTLPAKWSGKKLIPTGASISVTYKDEAGHEGSGTSSATRSSVSTPITFKIRPELNANGYLNGQSSRLIVSGAACSCEPIRVTVANSSQETYATQLDTWSDSNGSWETVFDMAGLPEKQDFTISAEYTDVNGSPYSITAKYEAFCSPADVTSPIYEAMSHISGMVEPGTAVALVVNGKKQKYYEFDVDRFGRISLDDVPMMFGGEDSFDIYVQDIAGNVAIKHYDIPEPEDPFEVKAQVNPLGKYFFQGDAETSSSYAATPISLKDFEKDKDTLEIPLILGMSYDVGKLSIQKKGNGIVINSSLDLGKNVDKEDYKVTEEQLYVYTTKPSEADIKDNKGKAYKYGEEIPLSKDGTIWIADKKEITVLADAMEELELFKYDESKAYEKYQEQ